MYVYDFNTNSLKEMSKHFSGSIGKLVIILKRKYNILPCTVGLLFCASYSYRVAKKHVKSQAPICKHLTTEITEWNTIHKTPIGFDNTMFPTT